MNLLLQTKLTAPVIRERLVPRSHLFQRLEDGLLQDEKFLRRLTLVAAPAGYGKTTLVAGWLQAAGRPFAWLSLDETDNDPSRFVSYLIAAVNSSGPWQAAFQASRAPQPPPAEALVSILLNEIAGQPCSLTLVLDDYHAIHTPQIHALVAFFLDHQPASIHLVIITREDPLLPVARLRARGQALEIRQDDLRFSPEESSRFISGVMGLSLTQEDMAMLDQRTEGWIAGLQLAALAMQGLSRKSTADVKEFIRTFAGSSRFIIDYLISEVFWQQPTTIQDFMLKSAILDRMTASLCDAVTGQAGSSVILEQLDQANLFIIPLDQKREWFRYHHLYAEFLRHHLRLRQPGLAQALHQSASQWYAAHGFLAEAVEHALSAEDWDQAGAMIGKARDSMLRRGEIFTLLTWYRKLPEVFLKANIEHIIGYAWPLVLSGQYDQAASLIDPLETKIEDGSRSQVDYYAIRAYLARSMADHAATISYSERALALLPQNNPAVRDILSLNLGIAYWHSGRLDETEQVMAEVERIGSQSGNVYATLTARFFRARTLASRGMLRRAETPYRQMLHESGQSPITALEHYDLATLYLEWNRLEEAEMHLSLGMEISTQTGNLEFVSSGHILRAYLFLARKSIYAAQEEADQAYALASKYPPGVQARSESMQVLVHLAAGNIEQAAQWAEKRAASADAHPFYRFLDLTCPRLMIAQGRRAEASGLLKAGCQEARRQGWGYGLVTALTLQSLAAGPGKEGLEALSEALHLAEPEGYLRTFLDAGTALVPLLREAVRLGICPRYAGEILAEMPESETPEAVPGLVEPLSEREMEVLRLVAAGLSNREIAHVLVVTPGTAKTHLHHICGKLGVRNRTEAAARARELKLV